MIFPVVCMPYHIMVEAEAQKRALAQKTCIPHHAGAVFEVEDCIVEIVLFLHRVRVLAHEERLHGPETLHAGHAVEVHEPRAARALPMALGDVGLHTRKADIQLAPATKSGRGWPSWAATRHTICEIFGLNKPMPVPATCSMIVASCASTVAGSAVAAPCRLVTFFAPVFEQCSAPMLRPLHDDAKTTATA